MRMTIKYFFLFSFLSLITYYFLTENILKPETFHVIDPNLKYILIWTDPNREPIQFLGQGQNTFKDYQCPVNNCYVTAHRTLMKRLTDFDVILFHGPEVERNHISLPRQRAPHQQYVFVSKESSHYYPIKNKKYRNFFNWSWTYKLNSELYYGYMVIKNKQGEVVGPKQNMHWLKIKDMKPIDDAFKEELRSKNIAAAWFVSNCVTPGKREQFAKDLKQELAKYNMTLDVYGQCGHKKCSRHREDDCYALVKRFYYFYLSFENSFSEDYVTEKLLTALLNNAVPIVYGGANYTRFMPDGAYLNARELAVENLAQRMVDAINNNETYYDFFRWRNYYSYHDPEDSVETNSYCKFCSKVNGKESDGENNVTNISFNSWWNS